MIKAIITWVRIGVSDWHVSLISSPSIF